ncbi:MAG: hypothetical protein M1114_06485 [Candidatus Dependentiae bacterium]|nr:hypothetical protein [Candidatus Dependentiae bacterium]
MDTGSNESSITTKSSTIPTITLISVDEYLQESYASRCIWERHDVIKAIDDDLIKSNNHLAIIACFTSKKNPLHCWETSFKKELVKKLCELLGIDKKEEHKYSSQIIRAGLKELVEPDKSKIPYEYSKTCSADIIFSLYHQLHLKRWDSANYQSIPLLKHSPYHCKLILLDSLTLQLYRQNTNLLFSGKKQD